MFPARNVGIASRSKRATASFDSLRETSEVPMLKPAFSVALLRYVAGWPTVAPLEVNMRGRILLLGLATLSTSCNTAGFAAVSIRPVYGFEDGCNPVTVYGHGFDDGTTVSIGDNPMTNLVQPDGGFDQGFRIDGNVPAGSAGTFADVNVTTAAGEKSTIPEGYYYLACPTTVLGEVPRTPTARPPPTGSRAA